MEVTLSGMLISFSQAGTARERLFTDGRDAVRDVDASQACAPMESPVTDGSDAVSIQICRDGQGIRFSCIFHNLRCAVVKQDIFIVAAL